MEKTLSFIFTSSSPEVARSNARAGCLSTEMSSLRILIVTIYLYMILKQKCVNVMFTVPTSLISKFRKLVCV